MKVHPRARGAAWSRTPEMNQPSASSPLARGRSSHPDARRLARWSMPASAGARSRTLRLANRARFIPARAGQPPFPGPRACGAASVSRAARSSGTGSSPPARGSRHLVIAQLLRPGFIPARAGQPRSGGPSLRCAWVHPRARGGVRSRGRSTRAAARFIPARAGQPTERCRNVCSIRVHPRARGAASATGHAP